MSQGDLLIFMNTVCWLFLLFFFFYIMLFSKFLPSIFKMMRIQLFFPFYTKKFIYSSFLSFCDKFFLFSLMHFVLHSSSSWVLGVNNFFLFFRLVFWFYYQIVSYTLFWFSQLTLYSVGFFK